MAAPNSSASQLGFKTQTTSEASVTPDLFLPFGEESLTRMQEPVRSDGIRSERLVIDDEEENGGNIEVGGSIAGDLPVKGASTLFKAMFGAVNTSGSNPYTHAFTPAHALPSLFLQTGAPDGGGTVHPKNVVGAKASTWEIAGEEGSFLTWSIDTIARRLTIGSRVVSDGVTNETTTVTSSTAAFTQADYGKDISGTGIPAGAYITAINSATSVTISAAATASGTGLSVTIGKALATASYPSSLSYFKMHMASLTIGGSAVPIKGFTIAGDNKIERRYFGGSRWSDEPTGTGELRDYTGTFNLEYLSNAQVDRYFAGDHFAVVLAATSGTSSITFSMNGRYDPDLTPSVNGRGRLMQEAPFRCSGSSDANAITCTLVNADSTAA